ncbi:hypothetical protein J6590_069449 [Homalodisca vitripennis]|nr:hypothetical protein J6590_069449 [Homalodisca vitripennis]
MGEVRRLQVYLIKRARAGNNMGQKWPIYHKDVRPRHVLRPELMSVYIDSDGGRRIQWRPYKRMSKLWRLARKTRITISPTGTFSDDILPAPAIAEKPWVIPLQGVLNITSNTVMEGAPAPATTEEVWVNPLEGVLDTTTEADLEGPPPTLVSGYALHPTPRPFVPWRFWGAVGAFTALILMYACAFAMFNFLPY